MKPTTSRAVEEFANKNVVFSSFLSTQHTCMDIITRQLDLQQPSNPQQTPFCVDTDVAGAIVSGWAPQKSDIVRWVANSSLANTSTGFGAMRMIVWVRSDRVHPYFVLENTVKNKICMGVITFYGRSDLVLDEVYLERFYNAIGGESGTASFNDVYDRCLQDFQYRLGWKVFATPQPTTVRPVLANAISFNFSADSDESVTTFCEIAVELAQLWTEVVLAEQKAEAEGGGINVDAAVLSAYDARLKKVVRTDLGNLIAVKLFGKEATEKIIEMTVGEM